MRRLIDDRRGVTAVEFALCAPLTLLMLFGIIESGKMIWTQQSLQHGVQAAARCAAINTTLCSTTGQIAGYASSKAWGLSPDPSTIAASKQSCGWQVTATYPYRFLPETGAGVNLTLHAESCFPHR